MPMMSLFREPLGFRLATLQVYNWGTFDGHIHQMSPEGHTAVITGANGSGKSTLVDALLTLLVDSRKRNYNLASGASKRTERSEKSYILGYYSRSRGETPLEVTHNTLRTLDDYSVLLAVLLLVIKGSIQGAIIIP